MAAGRGTRMNSDLPKALHRICGKPMLWFLLEKVKSLGAEKTIVVAGYKKERVNDFIESRLGVGSQRPVMVWQKELLGSGHAVN